jgi:hypothetical protein
MSTSTCEPAFRESVRINGSDEENEREGDIQRIGLGLDEGLTFNKTPLEYFLLKGKTPSTTSAL